MVHIQYLNFQLRVLYQQEVKEIQPEIDNKTPIKIKILKIIIPLIMINYMILKIKIHVTSAWKIFMIIIMLNIILN